MVGYSSLNEFLKNKFGCKVVKLSLDAGFTCPNRDGTLSHCGCIFCSPRGSGDFAGMPMKTISEQINDQKKLLSKKWNNAKYIAYFQAFTNTYAPINELRQKYYEAIECEDVCGIAIATRPDCLSDNVLALLQEISKKTYLWIELGLQTSNEETARFINRGYNNIVFEEAVEKLNLLNIDVVVHVILGLPKETEKDMLETVGYVCSKNIQGIKLQLLHVLKNTDLAKIYCEEPFHIFTIDEYVDLVCRCIDIIPLNIIIHRLTGDGAKNDLIAPLWSGNKKLVLNKLNKQISETCGEKAKTD